VVGAQSCHQRLERTARGRHAVKAELRGRAAWCEQGGHFGPLGQGRRLRGASRSDRRPGWSSSCPITSLPQQTPPSNGGACRQPGCCTARRALREHPDLATSAMPSWHQSARVRTGLLRLVMIAYSSAVASHCAQGAARSAPRACGSGRNEFAACRPIARRRPRDCLWFTSPPMIRDASRSLDRWIHLTAPTKQSSASRAISFAASWSMRSPSAPQLSRYIPWIRPALLQLCGPFSYSPRYGTATVAHISMCQLSARSGFATRRPQLRRQKCGFLWLSL